MYPSILYTVSKKGNYVITINHLWAAFIAMQTEDNMWINSTFYKRNNMALSYTIVTMDTYYYN